MKVGDLVQTTEDWWPYCKKGDVGMIVKSFYQKVCIVGGIEGRAPEDGGPEYAMEWGYVGLFGNDRRRLDRLSPVEVVA
jgi:hypothetical protein